MLDFGCLAAQQYIHYVAYAEFLVAFSVQAVDRGQYFLGWDCAVPRGWFVQARVAVAAGGGLLAEVVQELGPAAFDRLAQGEHRVQVHAQAAAMVVVALRGGDHFSLLDHVLLAALVRASKPAWYGSASMPFCTRNWAVRSVEALDRQ